MKKFFMCAVAVAATMSLTSCLSEEEVNLEKGNMGRIALTISAENELTTRAVQTVSSPDGWYAFVNGPTTYGTAASHRAIGSDLADFDFAYGSYTVTVSSHAKLDDALTGKGEAYYEGWGKQLSNDTSGDSIAVTVVAGSTSHVYATCGKAKNARLAIVNAGFSGTINSVTAAAKLSDNTTARQVSFTAEDVKSTEDASTKAFFRAGESVTFTFNYNIGTHSNKTAPITMTMGGAGTRNVLSIKSDANGNIQIMNISYDDAFDEGNVTESITISAETGEKL